MHHSEVKIPRIRVTHLILKTLQTLLSIKSTTASHMKQHFFILYTILKKIK